MSKTMTKKELEDLRKKAEKFHDPNQSKPPVIIVEARDALALLDLVERQHKMLRELNAGVVSGDVEFHDGGFPDDRVMRLRALVEEVEG